MDDKEEIAGADDTISSLEPECGKYIELRHLSGKVVIPFKGMYY